MLPRNSLGLLAIIIATFNVNLLLIQVKGSRWTEAVNSREEADPVLVKLEQEQGCLSVCLSPSHSLTHFFAFSRCSQFDHECNNNSRTTTLQLQ